MLMTIFGIDPGRLLDIRRRSIMVDNLLVTQDGEEFLVFVIVPFFLFPVFVSSQEFVDPSTISRGSWKDENSTCKASQLADRVQHC